MIIFISIVFILSANIGRTSTTKSQTIGDNNLYAACGRLCDKPDVDAIAPLSVPTDKQFLVIIVRDSLCSWIMDMNDPKQNRDLGRKHHFKYDLVESLYTIFDDSKSSDKFNVTALFTSGMVGEVWRSVAGYIKKDSDGPLPLSGLGYNMQKKVDASFGWQPDSHTRIVKIIQDDSYYTFDLTTKKRLSGPDSLTEDFSYDYKKLGKLQGVFSRGNDVHFFSGKNGYYIWKSNDGKTGVLSEKRSVIQDFYNCGTKYTTPKFVASQQPEETEADETSEQDIVSPVNSAKDEPTISSHYIKSDELIEPHLPTVANNADNKEVIADRKTAAQVSQGTDDSDDVDIDLVPRTIASKSNAKAEDHEVTNGNQRILLSIRLSIIMAMISIVEKILK